MFRTLLSLGVLACGCSAPYAAPRETAEAPAHKTSVTYSLKLATPELEAAAVSAAEAWHQAIGVEFVRVEVGAGDAEISMFEVGPGYCAKEEAACAHMRLPSHVGFVSGGYEACAYGVAMHELGHALGAGHTESGLMLGASRETCLPTVCPDVPAVEAVAAAGVVDVQVMAPCY